MPDHDFEGKTREDLAAIAELFGVLPRSEADRMTRGQLLETLERAERRAALQREDAADAQASAPAPAAGSDEAAVEAPVRKRGRPKAAAGAAKAADAAPAAASGSGASPAEAPVPAEAPALAEAPVSAPAPAPRGSRVGRAHRPAAAPRPEAAPEAVVAAPAAPGSAEPSPDAAPGVESVPASAPVSEPVADAPAAPAVLAAHAHRAPHAPHVAHVRPGRPERNDRSGRDGGRPDANRNGRPGDAGRSGRNGRNGRPDARGRGGRDAGRPQERLHPNVLPPSEYADDEYRDLESTAIADAENASREGQENGRPSIEMGETVEGVLELMPDGYGFLRRENYLQSNRDIYVPPQYIRRFGLRNGDYVSGPGKVQRETDRFQALLYIKEVNGLPPEQMLKRPTFDKLTPIYPDERFVLETVKTELSTRIIDLVAPIGKGQRGMVVSPPKAGKTILLQKIANAISKNNPEAHLIVLLIDERPEEVTDMQRSIDGEVVYSTFDKSPENHVKVSELVLDRAMRLVEVGRDVVILMDSMTRLARAYNLTINPTGRTLSGGLDPGALQGPKRFFGAARNIENGGSLTIISTSLIETGSRMDEVIFEEFKGTGNMEVYLDRKLSEKRIFPAIDINKSGTRREELLLSGRELDAVWTIRKAFSQLDTAAVTEMIINLLLKTANNAHFISSVNVSLNDKAVFEAMRGTRPGGNGGMSGGYGSNSSRNGMDD